MSAARFSESHHRTLIKSITFRLLVLTADGIIVYAITRKLDLALSVVIIRNIFAFGLYYVHERFWNNVHWGKHKKK